MKISLDKLADSARAIKKLADFDFGEPALNYKFMGVLETVDSETKKFMELRKKIIEKFRDKEKGEDIFIPFDQAEAFNKEMVAAGNVEIEINWDATDADLSMLKGFTANDMRCLDGSFLNIKGE